MSRFDEAWAEAVQRAAIGVDPIASLDGVFRVLYVVTDTEHGKAAFHVEFADGAPTAVTAGKLPRGEQADVTVTAAESTFDELWRGGRTRDAAFMSGDVKIEGAYGDWLDSVVPAFERDDWRQVWESAV